MNHIIKNFFVQVSTQVSAEQRAAERGAGPRDDGRIALPQFETLCDALHEATKARKTSKLAQKLGPTSVFYCCIPAGMHGPTCIFWADLTPFLPKAPTLLRDVKRARAPHRSGDSWWALPCVEACAKKFSII